MRISSGANRLWRPLAGRKLFHFSRVVCVIVFFSFLLSSCASLYFKSVPAPGETLKIRDIGELPHRELWHGFVFNGEKVGFVHFRIVPTQESQEYRLISEAHMRIRFMGMMKQIDMKSDDIVRPDLSLVSFHYEQRMDEKPLMLEGKIVDGTLMVRQRSGDEEKTAHIVLSGMLYPSSVINLYPLLQGMAVGSRYRYHVYDPQTQSITEVNQTVHSFEESEKLSLEPSFKVETHMHGHSATSWINRKGETIFEMGMGGVLITYKEDEEQAKRFLAEASFNKKDVIFDFSLVKTDRVISCPRNAASMKVAVWGLSGALSPLRGSNQEFAEESMEGKPAAVFLLSGVSSWKRETAGEPLNSRDRYRYLAPSHHIEADHPEIKMAAGETVRGATSAHEKVERLVRWVSREIKDEAVDSFSALEVLHSRKGECQAHTMLYAAMARAAGIPTKLVGGLVYMDGMGFLYHSWAESYINGWVPVDPTFNQVGVDATHIKLVEGHDWTSLLQLGRVIGQIRIRIIDYSCASVIPQ
ncbi:MAG: transglutaminase domain-containing protein [Deltaproteobacteria bacterium]|nr:transglutaminase domain-containing protein [Deltaproteobacteria bacterium]